MHKISLCILLYYCAISSILISSLLTNGFSEFWAAERLWFMLLENSMVFIEFDLKLESCSLPWLTPALLSRVTGLPPVRRLGASEEVTVLELLMRHVLILLIICCCILNWLTWNINTLLLVKNGEGIKRFFGGGCFFVVCLLTIPSLRSFWWAVKARDFFLL